MNEALSRRLRQTQFADSRQEALLALLVAASTLNTIVDAVCDAHGITRSQYNVLRILRGVHPQGHARREIAERMIDRAPDITRLVDRLQAQGLVKRSWGKDDQRQSIAVITAKGLKLLARMQPKLEAQTASCLADFSDGDLADLSRLCGLVLESAESHASSRRAHPAT